MDLPHRRFYTPATEYKSVRSEFNLFQDSGTSGEDNGAGGGGGFGLQPIPSVIDLPTRAGVGVEVGGIGSGVDSRELFLKMRVGSSSKILGLGGDEKMRDDSGSVSRYGDKESAWKDGQGLDVKRYDADGEVFFRLVLHDLLIFNCYLFSVNQSHRICWYSCLGY